MKNKILELQNQEDNQNKIAAFEEMYFEAKKLMNLKKIMTGVLVFLNILAVYLNLLTDWTQALTVIILFVDEFYFKNKISNIKEKAAKLQQEFDYTVYDLPDKNFLEKIDKKKINEYAKKYLERIGNYNNIKDWYKDIDNLSQEEAIMKCQKTNYLWDKSLKIKYNNQQLVIMFSICIVYFFILFKTNTGLMDIFSKQLFVISPLLLTYLSDYLDNKKSIKAAAQLIDSCNKISTYQINSIIILQEKIFEYRKNCYLIPDNFYYKNRDKYEAEINKTITK